MENGTISYKKSKFKSKKLSFKKGIYKDLISFFIIKKIKRLLSSKENDIYLSNFLKKEINIEKKKPKKFYSQLNSN